MQNTPFGIALFGAALAKAERWASMRIHRRLVAADDVRLRQVCVFIGRFGTFLAAASARAADFGLTWTGDSLAVAQGGLQQDTRHLGALDISLDSSFKLFGRHDAQVHAVLQNTYGGGLSEELIGDLQTASNIDADPGIRLLELWVDVAAADGWSLRLASTT